MPTEGPRAPDEPDGSLHDFNSRLSSFIRRFVEAGAARPERTVTPPRFPAPPPLSSCWEVQDCTRTDCRAFGNSQDRCWLAVGLSGDCGLECSGDQAAGCLDCPVLVRLLAEPEAGIREGAVILAHQLSTSTSTWRDRALRDPLTGLHNRRMLHELLPQAAAGSARLGSNVWLIMLDLDGLKRLNDSAGHHVGDEALVELAGVLRSTVRKSDFVFRLGGDEFLLALPHATRTLAQLVRGRVQRALEDWNRGHSERRGFRLSVSAGLAPLDTDSGLASSLMAADQAMYADKAAGSMSTGGDPRR